MKVGRDPDLFLPGPAGPALDRLRAVTAAPGGRAPRSARYIGTITDDSFTLRLARTVPSPWRLHIVGHCGAGPDGVVFTWSIGWSRLGTLINELIIGSGFLLAVIVGLYVARGALAMHALFLVAIGLVWVVAPVLDLWIEQRRMASELKQILVPSP